MALPTGTVAYWHLNEANGNASDETGNHDLTNNGTVTYVAGKLNNCAYFQNNKYFSAAGSSDFDFGTGTFTIAFWLKHPLTTSSRILMFNNTGWEAAGMWGIFVRDTDDKLYFQTELGNVLVSTTAVDNTWQRWVYVREGTGANQFKLYLNGAAVADKTGTCSSELDTCNTFLLGGGHPVVGNELDGYLDDVLIIKGDAWDAADVAADYNGGDGLEYSATTTSNFHVNVSDTWKEVNSGDSYVQVGDNWKAISAAYVNVGDTWKQIF